MGKNTTPVATVATSSLRATRIARLTTALLQMRKVAKQAKHFAATQQSNQLQYLQAVAQLQATYNITNPQHLAPNARANSATVQPSAAQIMVNGVLHTPCKAVHALAAIHHTRKATLAACALAGINPSTASTQYGIYAKQQKLAN
jgi:hypothetical protein